MFLKICVNCKANILNNFQMKYIYQFSTSSLWKEVKKDELKENHIVFIIIKTSSQVTNKQQVNMGKIFMQQQKSYRPFGWGLELETSTVDCNWNCCLVSNPPAKLPITYEMFSPSPGQSFWQQFQTAMFYAINSLMIELQFMCTFIPHGSFGNPKFCMRNSKSCSFKSYVYRLSVT